MGTPYPPLALVALVATAVALSVRALYYSSEPEVTLQTVGGSRFDDFLPALVFTRLTSAAFIAHRLYVITRPEKALTVKLRFFKGSQFTGQPVVFTGARRFVTFTVQSWALLGVYFLASALASACLLFEKQLIAPRVISLLFAANFAVAHLVSAATTHVLVPLAWRAAVAEAAGGPVVISFMRRDGLILHNANVILLNLDALLSTAQIDWTALAAPILWGCQYTVFAWFWAFRHNWVAYPFLDHTLPLKLSLPLHVALLATIAAFFAAGLALTTGLKEASFTSRALCHAILLFAVVRFYPPTVKSPPATKSS